jgi:hypothetical protein
MAALIVQRRRPGELSHGERDELYDLYARHYAATDPARFVADLTTKDWVLTLHHGASVVGFSTQALRQHVSQSGQALLELFSGDTVIDPAYWGSQALSTGFARLAGRLAREHAPLPIYWMLISKGYRTWRYLPLFAHEYWPNPGCPTPPANQALLDELARARFGAAYDSSSGLLRFADSQGHLQPELATVRADLAERPEIRFFLERNPGYVRGDELVCLTQLTPDNLRGPVLRAFMSGWHEAQ